MLTPEKREVAALKGDSRGALRRLFGCQTALAAKQQSGSTCRQRLGVSVVAVSDEMWLTVGGRPMAILKGDGTAEENNEVYS
jgi:hypothetical protein